MLCEGSRAPRLLLTLDSLVIAPHAPRPYEAKLHGTKASRRVGLGGILPP